MKRLHIIIIVGVVIAVIIGLSIGLGMRGFTPSGSIGVIEIENMILSSKIIVKDLKNFADDPAISAVIMRINSPGGVAAATQEIYREVKKLQEKKKVIVSMGVVAASGGYYVALPADVIVANPSTITGSIGVIMQFPVIEELLKKIGIDFTVIKSKDYKDIGSPYRRMGDKEEELLQDVVLDVYDQFFNATVEHRNLPKDSVLKFADGRILTGRQAKEIGLIDTLGSFEDAVEIAGDLVGIEKPRLIYPPKRFSFVDMFIKPMETLMMPKLQFLWRP
ncbi:MAG: signal peptide peptidase SppA [candidate division WOR-3 bacterium]|nr:MAG: signal peptide peptidase SppA [candidate division WOR-3 bacterium]